MSNLIKSMAALEYLAKKSDVVGQMRVSISFDTERDSALFQEEVRREMENKNLGFTYKAMGYGETIIYGIKVRIL